MIRVEHLSAGAGDAALSDVSFEVAAGEVAVVDPCGGSAAALLLRVVAALSRPRSGRVEINGTDAVARVVEARQHVWHANLQPRLCRTTVRAYLELLAATRNPSLTATALTRLLQRYELPPDASVDSLATSIQARLDVGATLVVAPRVLVGAVPVDAALNAMWREAWGELQHGGTTMLLSCEGGVAGVEVRRTFVVDRGRLLPQSTGPLAASGVGVGGW